MWLWNWVVQNKQWAFGFGIAALGALGTVLWWAIKKVWPKTYAASGNLVPAASQLVGKENSINGDREGLFRTCLYVDLDYLPALASAVNEGPWLGNRFVTIHVEIALFRAWIAVVPKHDLLGGSHTFTPVLPTIRVFCPAGLSAQSRFINQPVRNLFPVMIVGIVHRAQKLGLEFVSKNRNVAGVAFSSLMLASMLDDRSGNTYPIVGLATAYDVVVNFLGL
jgi:hypothetical protein